MPDLLHRGLIPYHKTPTNKIIKVFSNPILSYIETKINDIIEYPINIPSKLYKYLTKFVICPIKNLSAFLANSKNPSDIIPHSLFGFHTFLLE